jgi:hypothetical protein
MADHSPPFLITNITDLNRFSEAPVPHVVHFHITNLPVVDFSRFVQTLAAKRSLFQSVTQVTVEANILWNRLHAKDFMEILSLLPNLRSLVWHAATNQPPVPIPHLTILCTRCPRLETLVLHDLPFLSTQATLTQFCQALKNHAHLKLFQCYNFSTVLPTWVDELLNALVFVESLECIDIRVAPNDTNNQESGCGRALLGLCRSGKTTELAWERFRQLLQDNPTNSPRLYPKIRLWIADGYLSNNSTNDKNNPPLLELAPFLARNTVVKDFRVRGSALAAERWITKKVVNTYREFLESGENICLTSCDLMTQQGHQIDFYCRLNSMGRRKWMLRLQEMTREEWVEDILVRFSNDVDVLYYWNRLHPVFLTAGD